MTAPHADALARLIEQGFTPETAELIVGRFTARYRAVDRLIRIHRPEYKRLLAEEHARGEQP